MLGPFSAQLKSVCVHRCFISIKCALFHFFFIARLSNGPHFWELFQNASLPAFSQLHFPWVTLSWMQSTSTEGEELQLTLRLQLGKLADALMKWILMYANGPLSQQFFCNFALNEWATNISIFRGNWSCYHFHHHIHSPLAQTLTQMIILKVCMLDFVQAYIYLSIYLQLGP